MPLRKLFSKANCVCSDPVSNDGYKRCVKQRFRYLRNKRFGLVENHNIGTKTMIHSFLRGGFASKSFSNTLNLKTFEQFKIREKLVWIPTPRTMREWSLHVHEGGSSLINSTFFWDFVCADCFFSKISTPCNHVKSSQMFFSYFKP